LAALHFKRDSEERCYVRPVIFTQFVDDDLGCASYLVGDERAGVAVVVDPPFAVEPVLAEAARRGVELVRAVETHTHADHLSGHGRLALEHDLPVSIHPAAGVTYPHDSLADGDEIAVGDVVLRCLHTPGHRPEHVALVVTDRSRGPEPWLVLTGDSLFVGDTARPDLAVGVQEGAEGLFHSLRRLLELPDGIEVFPGHVAGSLCGRAMSSRSSTTIGFERRFNPMLTIAQLDAFVAESGAVSAPKPPNLERLVALNAGPFVGSPPPLRALDGATAGAQTLDVRPVDAYFRGHRPGAVSVPVDGTGFATKAGFVLDPERSVELVADDADEAERAARLLRSVGLLDLAGYGFDRGDETMEPVGLDELERLLAGGVVVVDVREKDERDSGYIAGSRNIPYRLLGLWPDADTGPVVTVCESGARAVVAASVLAARGVEARPVADGGITAWRASGRATVAFRRCGSH
jgi:glyoxylase-like metal-dependent hydrolase (beta-lactamase superfamily II)/rhodanese-related sulfurtransferase